MADNLITCPQCRAAIPLSEALSHQIREQARREFDEEKKILAEQVAKMNAEAARKLQAERETIEKEAVRRAQEKQAVEMRDLQLTVSEQRKKLEESQRAELDLRREKREIEEQKKELTLQVQRQIDQERRRIEEQTLARAAQAQHQKDLESAKREADLLRTIEDLKRKAEQGSQQTQGEVVELELENFLKAQFPGDQVEPVAKGIRGADVVQRVFRQGKSCGTIIWESKQTKLWSDGWIDKLRDDQRQAKADVAVLLTAALPKGVSTFALINGVWVTNQVCMSSVAATLRWAMIQHALARSLAEGTEGKMKTLYEYLTGPEFRQRIQAISDSSRGMRDQLEKEKRLFMKNWSERDKQILQVEENLLGMYGDLKGMGAQLEHLGSVDEAPEEIESPEPTRAAAVKRPAEISHRSSSPAREVEVEDDQLF